jgi:hypothetical protein
MCHIVARRAIILALGHRVRLHKLVVRLRKMHSSGFTACSPCLSRRDCGWFPTYSITEDFALGIELKSKGYNALYLKEYLAFGGHLVARCSSASDRGRALPGTVPLTCDSPLGHGVRLQARRPRRSGTSSGRGRAGARA